MNFQIHHKLEVNKFFFVILARFAQLVALQTFASISLFKYSTSFGAIHWAIFSHFVLNVTAGCFAYICPVYLMRDRNQQPLGHESSAPTTTPRLLTC